MCYVVGLLRETIIRRRIKEFYYNACPIRTGVKELRAKLLWDICLPWHHVMGLDSNTNFFRKRLGTY